MDDDDPRPGHSGDDAGSAPTNADDDPGPGRPAGDLSWVLGSPPASWGRPSWAWLRGRPQGVVLVAVLVVAAGVWAVRSTGGSGRSVGHTVSGFFQAQRDEDCRRLMDLLTEESWSQGGELSRGQFLEQCADAVEGYDAAVYQPRLQATGARFDVEIVDDEGARSAEGDRAVVRVESVTAGYDESSDREGRLVREGGEWRVEPDPYVLPIGRTVEDTVRGYVDAYNDGDCERLLDHVSEATWSEGGDVDGDELLAGCGDAAEARQALAQLPVQVGEIQDEDEDDDQATAQVTLLSAGEPVTSVPDSVTLVREGLEWKLDVGDRPGRGGAGTPFLNLELVELETRLLDEVATAAGSCFDYGERPASDGDGGDASSGIGREYACDAFQPSLTLYRFADDEEARRAADRMATAIVQDPPPTAEDLAETGLEVDPAELAAAAARYRPNQAAAVPGMSDAVGVLTSCEIDGCSGAVAFAVRHGVLVEAQDLFGDIDHVAALLRAQLERL